MVTPQWGWSKPGLFFSRVFTRNFSSSTAEKISSKKFRVNNFEYLLEILFLEKFRVNLLEIFRVKISSKKFRAPNPRYEFFRVYSRKFSSSVAENFSSKKFRVKKFELQTRDWSFFEYFLENFRARSPKKFRVNFFE